MSLPKPPVAPIALALTPLLNHRFGDLVRQGDLDFLEGRRIAIAVTGAPWALALGLAQGRWQVAWADGSEPAELLGNLRAFAILACGEGDADGLFFQRQLEMRGETELAMELKALLGRVSLLPPVPEPLQAAVARLRTMPFLSGSDI
ncbi:SCP2 sterol-binding domain-containing protein [Ferrimonas sediminicola]|uniref:SCP2 sterol-binding domain-containing protein n=1 Tax=Ferrimonas sediminicola TaxID=2569538 RepID=A0A4U1BFL5_9GAMM|nr:SCP2 sterol-binding domain-containing protein [Ferrimonas sediminicola]TKB49720.1 SCP2 sterol-binding domain-containing protein [Ferrimonas sediminicola]